MKRRIFRVMNFLALNLLFFALYLNFVHNDNDGIKEPEKAIKREVVKGNVLVKNPEQYLNESKAIESSKKEEEVERPVDVSMLTTN